MKNFSIISMSKVYESEDFYKPFLQSDSLIDCTDIEGVNCYADENAIATLRQRLQGVNLEEIHFIDSGNFHYLSYFFLERINTDFALVLIDKHPDCKTPMFEDMLSCGGWIKNALERMPHLKRVYMVGTDTDLLYELDDLGKMRDKVLVVRMKEKLFDEKLPMYVSLDKDVLSDEVVETNWDQGIMSLEELDEWLQFILDYHFIMGVDICGEPDAFESSVILNLSSEINSHLLSVFHKI